jgi:hypothetical protein
MKKIIALAAALSVAAPLAAIAAPQSVAQKVEQTYHTQFPVTSGNQVSQTYGYGG